MFALFVVRNAAPLSEDSSTSRYELWDRRPAALDARGIWQPRENCLGEIFATDSPVKLEPGDPPVMVKLVEA